MMNSTYSTFLAHEKYIKGKRCHCILSTTFIPLSISLMSLMRLSLLFIPSTCSCLALRAMRALTGMSNTITATPASTDGPRVCHRKYNATHICQNKNKFFYLFHLSNDFCFHSFLYSPFVNNLVSTHTNQWHV